MLKSGLLRVEDHPLFHDAIPLLDNKTNFAKNWCGSAQKLSKLLIVQVCVINSVESFRLDFSEKTGRSGN